MRLTGRVPSAQRRFHGGLPWALALVFVVTCGSLSAEGATPPHPGVGAGRVVSDGTGTLPRGAAPAPAPVAMPTPMPQAVRPAAAAPTPALLAPRRIVIALDNSKSMRVNDPQGLVRDAVRSVILRFEPTDAVGLAIFDTSARLLVEPRPLAEPGAREALLAAISGVSFDGQWTDIPSGLERALYELKRIETPDTPRLIVLVTDGRIETGRGAQQDEARARWLQESLLPDCKASGVRVFGVAFTEKADWSLLQAMAQATGGSYFRALAERDVAGIFEELRASLVPPPPPPAPEVAVQRVERLPPPVVVEAKTPAWAVVALVLSMLLALAAVVITWRRSRSAAGQPHSFIEVALHDLATGQVVRMDKKLLRVGRRAECDLVIDKPTMSGQHAQIEERDGIFYLKDLRSTNGTFVNDKRVEGEVILRNGDVLRFDKYKYAFEGVAAAGENIGDQTLMRFGGDATIVGGATDPVSRPQGSGPTSPECAEHPHRPATEVCVACGRHGCKVCIQDVDGSPTCSRCS